MMMDGAHERVQERVARGKAPIHHHRLPAPPLCIAECASIIALHLVNNRVIIGDIHSGRQCWEYVDPDIDELGPHQQPYRSLRVTAARIVIMWPNGYVGFIEPNTPEFQAQIDEARKKVDEEAAQALRERLYRRAMAAKPPVPPPPPGPSGGGGGEDTEMRSEDAPAPPPAPPPAATAAVAEDQMLNEKEGMEIMAAVATVDMSNEEAERIGKAIVEHNRARDAVTDGECAVYEATKADRPDVRNTRFVT
jgi:hypothetical protein